MNGKKSNPRERLEERVVALLLGDLSSEEAAEVRARLETDSDLAGFRRQMEQTIGLVREAIGSSTATATQASPVQLSEERRQALLERFRKPAVAKKKRFVLPRAQVAQLRWAAPLALAACLILFLGIQMSSLLRGPEGRFAVASVRREDTGEVRAGERGRGLERRFRERVTALYDSDDAPVEEAKASRLADTMDRKALGYAVVLDAGVEGVKANDERQKAAKDGTISLYSRMTPSGPVPSRRPAQPPLVEAEENYAPPAPPTKPATPLAGVRKSFSSRLRNVVTRSDPAQPTPGASPAGAQPKQDIAQNSAAPGGGYGGVSISDALGISEEGQVNQQFAIAGRPSSPTTHYFSENPPAGTTAFEPEFPPRQNNGAVASVNGRQNWSFGDYEEGATWFDANGDASRGAIRPFARSGGGGFGGGGLINPPAVIAGGEQAVQSGQSGQVAQDRLWGATTRRGGEARDFSTPHLSIEKPATPPPAPGVPARPLQQLSRSLSGTRAKEVQDTPPMDVATGLPLPVTEGKPLAQLGKAVEADYAKNLSEFRAGDRESLQELARRESAPSPTAAPVGVKKFELGASLGAYDPRWTGVLLASPDSPHPNLTVENEAAVQSKREQTALNEAPISGMIVVPEGERSLRVVPRTEAAQKSDVLTDLASVVETAKPQVGRTFTQVEDLDALKPSGVASIPPAPTGPNAVRDLKEGGFVVSRSRRGEEVRRMSKIAREAEAAVELELIEAAPKQAAPAQPLPEIQTSHNAFSTFSLNVSDVSFKLAAASLANSQLPEAASVRSEEFINAFHYHDPAPAPNARFAFASEQARNPFEHNRDLMRLSLKTAAIGREAGRPLNLVLLIDSSGSMERADRVRIVREALAVLARQLTAQDRVSVVAFSRTPRLWVDGMQGGQPDDLVRQVGNLNPEGGTNIELALDLAYSTAEKHFLTNGNNRVILMTDGAANLGTVDPGSLKAKVEAQRKKGLALDCFGVGWEGYNDDLLEVLSRNGDGRYGFLNNPLEVATEFAGQLAGALRVAAADVKAQVEFNPERVVSWRQIGYEKHQLTKEQFRDNTVDAAEIGAAESGTALYSIQVNGRGNGPLGFLRVRYKVPSTGRYHEQEWMLPYNPAVPPLDQAYPSMRLATVAASFAEWLAQSPYAANVTLAELQNYLRGVPETFSLDPRPRQLAEMIQQARLIAGQ